MRNKIEPVDEIYYPDEHGYLGFSLLVWGVSGIPVNSVVFYNKWGGFHLDRIKPDLLDKVIDYVFEGRFFVYGKLVVLAVETGEKERVFELQKGLFEKWKPIMDKIIQKERGLMQQPDRHGVHIDEILTHDLVGEIENTFNHWVKEG